MKHSITIIFLLTTNVMFAQKLTLPEKPYILVIGKDSIVTETVIEEAPNHYENFTGENKAAWSNVGTHRVWTYLFKNEKHTINYPQRIDTVYWTNLLTYEGGISIDTTDHIDINKMIDTISMREFRKLLNTEIQVYFGTKKLQVREIRVQLVWLDGKIDERDIRGEKIWKDTEYNDYFKSYFSTGCFIITRVSFFDEKNEPNGLSGKIAWKIR